MSELALCLMLGHYLKSYHLTHALYYIYTCFTDDADPEIEMTPPRSAS